MMENFVDVSEAFEGLTQPIVLYRPAAGSYTAGKWVGGTPTTPSINAVIQNATADDMLALPEGLRSEEGLKIHTIDEVKTASEASETNADQFTYDGSKWMIQHVFDRKIGGYYKAIATRIKSNVA